MKRSKLNKVSKQPISKIQKLLWIECRRVANDIYKPQNGPYKCYTCNRTIEGSNKQLGHVPWPKSVLGALLKYDMRCLRWQCYHCNINCGGMGTEAYKRMLKEEGKAYMDKLEKDRQETIKAYDFYLELLAYYKGI